MGGGDTLKIPHDMEHTFFIIKSSDKSFLSPEQ